MNIFMLAQAQDAAGAAGQEPANMFQQILASPMFMFVIIIVLFWVMLIRPQRKAQKEQQARIAALQRGDKVITNAGLHGFVEKVNERTVSLKIAEGVVIELEKNAIVQVEKYVFPLSVRFLHPPVSPAGRGGCLFLKPSFSGGVSKSGYEIAPHVYLVMFRSAGVRSVPVCGRAIRGFRRPRENGNCPQARTGMPSGDFAHPPNGFGPL